MATGTRVQPPAEKDLSTQGHEARACDDSGGRAWPKAHASDPPLADTLGRRASAQRNDGARGQREEGVARGARVQPPAARTYQRREHERRAETRRANEQRQREEGVANGTRVQPPLKKTLVRKTHGQATTARGTRTPVAQWQSAKAGIPLFWPLGTQLKPEPVLHSCTA